MTVDTENIGHIFVGSNIQHDNIIIIDPVILHIKYLYKQAGLYE